MNSNPIFTTNFLSHYISDFRISSVPDIRGITIIIRNLVQELESGKMESLKEEEIKSRFVTLFFGDVLGFNYGNSNEWLLREEKKSITDGKKSDGALGYFYKEKEKDDVRAIIEIKDANTILDKKQNRRAQETPIEQAFSYVSKMGGNCKWVIVSNLKEIKFYVSNDSSKCQIFFLKDLVQEDKLKELLFLFHKDRFIKKEDNSQTDLLLGKVKLFTKEKDVPIHIIDKIHNCIKRFEGLGSVDPNYIATLYPFNILDEYVWHYHDGNLFTINKEIYNLLNEIEIADDNVVISSLLKNEIEEFNVIDAVSKLEYIFLFLNHCMIEGISAIKDYEWIKLRNKKTIGFTINYSFHYEEGSEGVFKSIQLLKNKKCDCLSCTYRRLDFRNLLERLKAGIGNEWSNTPEYAFGNYLVASNNYKTTYHIYTTISKNTKGKEGKEIEYFLSKLNIKLLYNLIKGSYQYSDSVEIINEIKSIDLDKVIYDEIEFSIEQDVKNYLIGLKEDKLIYKLQDEIDEIIYDLEKLKTLYNNGGIQHMGADLIRKLYQAYFSLYLHVNRNYIIYDAFRRYESLVEKCFNGLLISYQTKEVGLKEFDEFFLTEAIIHIPRAALQKMLKGFEELKTTEECVNNLLQKLTNLISSYFDDGLFNDPYKNSLFKEYSTSFSFRERFAKIFSNLFTIILRLEISEKQFHSHKKILLKFLKVESELGWFDLEQFSLFLLKKGELFSSQELLEILKISIEKDRYNNVKYSKLIETISEVFIRNYKDYRIDNLKLIQSAILKSSSDSGNRADYNHLITFLKITDEKCRKVLVDAIEEELDKNFTHHFYFDLLIKSDYSYDTKGYFFRFCEAINKERGGTYKRGKLKLTDLLFYRLTYLMYKFEIDFKSEELTVLTNLNAFEKWILNPYAFDYGDFKVDWLLDIDNSIFLNRLKNINEINKAVDERLNESFNSQLASIKYKYFNRQLV